MASFTVATITDNPALNETAARNLVRESGGRLWGAYAKKPPGYSNLQIYCAFSDDEGLTWTETQVTDNGTEPHKYPSLAIDANNDLNLVFSATGRGAYTSRYSVLYMKRTSGVWGGEEEVALKNVTTPGQTRPCIAIDGADDVSVVWYGKGWSPNTGQDSINYRKRTSGSWGSVETIANESTTQRSPAIAIDSSNNDRVVWSGRGWGANTGQFNIQYSKRTSSSADWGNNQEAITDTSADNQERPSIALDSSDDVHVAWYRVNVDVYYRKRTTSWQTMETITSDIDSDEITFCSIAIDGNDIIQVVYNYGSYPAYLHYRRRTTSWSDAIIIYTGDEIFTCSLLWAKHPSWGVPNRSYAIWEELASKVLFGFPVIVYPSGPARVTGLRHRYTSADVEFPLTLEVDLGGASIGSLTQLSLENYVPDMTVMPAGLADYIAALLGFGEEEQTQATQTESLVEALSTPEITPPGWLGPFFKKVEGGTEISFIDPAGNKVVGGLLRTGFPF